jgi:hypothetical protein
MWQATQRARPGRFARKMGWTWVLKNSKSNCAGAGVGAGDCWTAKPIVSKTQGAIARDRTLRQLRIFVRYMIPPLTVLQLCE